MRPTQPAVRFRHLPSRLGQEPMHAEVVVFSAAKAYLSGVEGALPRLLVMPDGSVVAVIDTRDAEGRACVGLAVELPA